MEQLKWISENWMQVLAAVLAVMVLAEGVIRALEVLAKGLLVVARWTATTKDDEALEGAAKWLHSAAEWLAAATAWLRPFSLRGPTPGIHAGKLVTLVVPGREAETSAAAASSATPATAARAEDDTNPGGIAKKSRGGFVEWQVLVEIGGWGLVIVVGAILGALLTGCGGSLAGVDVADLDPEEVHQVGCELTAESCKVCESAQALYCAEGSAGRNETRCTATGVLCLVCTMSERLFCSSDPPEDPGASSGGAATSGGEWVAPPAIDREYHGET